jgi:hypothetical protein
VQRLNGSYYEFHSKEIVQLYKENPLTNFGREGSSPSVPITYFSKIQY